MSYDYSDCCIVTFSDREWYHSGVERMQQSLQLVGYTGGFIHGTEYPEGCAHESVARKCYKPFMMLKAFVQGYQRILWLDSSMWAIRPINELMSEIGNTSCYSIDDGWNTGLWSTDSCLQEFGISREESFSIFHIASGCVGIFVGKEIMTPGEIFLRRWLDCAKNLRGWKGPRWIKDGFCSDDDRVKGHRADQTVASILLWQLGMKPLFKTDSHVTWRYHGDPLIEPHKCIMARGGVRPGDLDPVPYED